MSTQTNSSRITVPYGQYVPVVLTAVVGIAVTLGVFFAAYSWERSIVRREFDSLAEDRFQAIGNMMDAIAKQLDFTDNVFQVGPQADSSEFPHYVRSLKALLERDLAGHLELNGLTWAPRVAPDERTAYEQAAREVFDPRFQLVGPDASADKRKDAPPADSYPVYLCLGNTALRNRLGDDLALDPAIWEMMQRARDMGVMLAGTPMKISDDADRMGYRIYAPLYVGEVPGNTEARRKANTGFLCVDLAVGELIDIAFENITPVGIEVSLVDETDEIDVNVCRHRSRLLQTSAACDASAACKTLAICEKIGGCSSDKLEATKTADFFGRKVLLRCDSTAVFWNRRTVWQPWVLLIGGLALTVLATGHRFALASRASTIERVVSARLTGIQREAEQRRQADGK